MEFKFVYSNSERMSMGLSFSEYAVLNLIRHRRYETAQNTAELLGISRMTVFNNLKALKEKNLIKIETPVKFTVEGGKPVAI